MKTRDAAILGLCLIVTLGCYLPHLVETFVGLDVTSYEPVLLTPKPLQTALDVMADFKGTIVPGYYAPLGSLSLIADRVLAGSFQATPKVTFAINLTLHCLNGLLMWWLLRSLGFGEAVALASVFVFLIHPMQVSVVAWFAERKTLLATSFYLVCYLLYLRAGFSEWGSRDSTDSRCGLTHSWSAEEQTRTSSQPPADSGQRSIVLYLASLAAFVLGLLTKPTVSVFPLVWMWGTAFGLNCSPGVEARARVDTARHHLANLWIAVVPLIPFFAAAMLIGSIALRSEPATAHLLLSERLPVVGAAILFYLHKAIAPVNLMYLYPPWDVDPYSVWWWIPFLGVGAAVILLFRYRRHISRSFTWGVGNFLVPLLPAAGVVSFGFFQYSYVANHFAYLSMVGAAACVGTIFIAGVRSASMPLKAFVVIFGVLYSVFLAAQTWSQASTWESRLKLWEDNVSKCDSCLDAQGGLGAALLEAGQYREAIPHLEIAVAGRPESATDRYNLAEAKAQLGDLQGAMHSYLRAIELKPTHARAHIGLGVVLQSLGNTRRAADEFQRAAELAPYLLAPHYNLAIAEQQSGELDQAIAHYKEVLRLDPEHFATHNNIGAAYLSLGQFDKAQAHFKKALEIRPDSEFALKNLQRLREEIRKQQGTQAVKPPKETNPGAPSPQ